MAANINKLPFGLLGFLGIKNGGEYPRDLSALLQPTIDLMEMYASLHADVDNTTVAVNAASSFVAQVVPQDQAWLVLQHDVTSVALAAGQALQIAPTLRQFGTVGGAMVIGPSSDRAAVGERATSGTYRPYYLPPGASAGVIATVLTAGPINVSVSLRFARLPL